MPSTHGKAAENGSELLRCCMMLALARSSESSFTVPSLNLHFINTRVFEQQQMGPVGCQIPRLLRWEDYRTQQIELL